MTALEQQHAINTRYFHQHVTVIARKVREAIYSPAEVGKFKIWE